MNGTRWILAGLLMLAAGCAHTPEPVPVAAPPTPELYPSAMPSGSLWRQGLGDVYADRKARRLGDIVTVNIVEETSATQEASTDSTRDSGLDAAIKDVFGLPTNFGMYDFLGSRQPFSPTLQGDYKRNFKGSGTTTRKGKLVATLTAKVVEVLPGGNLRIAGRRQVKVNREKQFITLEGIIRPDDISLNNMVYSTQVADAQIKYTGRGVLGDVQGPGWFARIMDWLWPI